MGLTQSKLAVGDLIFDARLCGPEGGAVAWALATSHPQRLKSLTVLSTPHPIALQESRKADPKQDRRLDYVRFSRLRDGSPEEPTEPEGLRAAFDRACRKT
jgi:pimeloyl-ACP methyl ester carboxylesterase